MIKNHHPSVIAPLASSVVGNIVKNVMNGEDCSSFIIDINLVRNSEIKRINKRFLNHNYNTDIITFPYSEKQSKIVEGELFISLDEVKSNSVLFQSSFRDEFARVVIHGCLHLAGYDDRTKKQKELIRKMENFYLGKLEKKGRTNVIRKST